MGELEAVERGPGVHRVDGPVDTLVAELRRQGWAVYELEGVAIHSRRSFFKAVRQRMPLDPELHSNRSWDALEDSLWGGFDELPQRDVALVWKDSSRMADEAPED